MIEKELVALSIFVNILLSYISGIQISIIFTFLMTFLEITVLQLYQKIMLKNFFFYFQKNLTLFIMGIYFINKEKYYILQ